MCCAAPRRIPKLAETRRRRRRQSWTPRSRPRRRIQNVLNPRRGARSSFRVPPPRRDVRSTNADPRPCSRRRTSLRRRSLRGCFSEPPDDPSRVTDRGGEREGTSEIETDRRTRDPRPCSRRTRRRRSPSRISISESLLARRAGEKGSRRRRSRAAKSRRRRPASGRAPAPALSRPREGSAVGSIVCARSPTTRTRPRRTRRAASRGTPRGTRSRARRTSRTASTFRTDF